MGMSQYKNHGLTLECLSAHNWAQVWVCSVFSAKLQMTPED